MDIVATFWVGSRPKTWFKKCISSTTSFSAMEGVMILTTTTNLFNLLSKRMDKKPILSPVSPSQPDASTIKESLRMTRFQKRPEIFLCGPGTRESTTNIHSDWQMGLDLLLFQADRDGNPDLIKQSQRARFKSEEIVDEIQTDYKKWTQGKFLAWICWHVSSIWTRSDKQGD